MIAAITKFRFCTEEVPMLVEGQNFSSIRYVNPITKILHHNYTNTACNPLYPNVVKLKDGSFQQYGETSKKFNREIYQWSTNSKLNLSDGNLHRSFFCTSDVKQVKLLKQFAIIVAELSVGKHSKIRMENTVIRMLFTGTTSFNKKLFLQLK